ncbi:MAG: hypothetical protein GX550_05450, partial [Syntrophomonadaceae bacterium]|nr:hypothetical protein [Syntrophomonadaceae bacterium]
MEQDEGFSDEPDEDRKKDMRLVATIEYIVKEFWFAIWISKTKEDMLTAYDIHLFGMELPMLTVSERIILWNVFAQRYNLEEDVDTVLCANQYILTPKGIMDALR